MKILREKYIDRIKEFMKALENGKPWEELEEIRKKIRDIAVQLDQADKKNDHPEE